MEYHTSLKIAVLENSNHLKNVVCIMNESPFKNNASDLCETCKRNFHISKAHI